MKAKDIEFMLDLFEKTYIHLEEYEVILWRKMHASEGEESENYRTLYLSVGEQIQKMEIASYVLDDFLDN